MSEDPKRRFGKDAPPPTNSEIDEALDKTFPASDPPAYTTPHRKEGEAPANDKTSKKPTKIDRDKPLE